MSELSTFEVHQHNWNLQKFCSTGSHVCLTSLTDRDMHVQPLDSYQSKVMSKSYAALSGSQRMRRDLAIALTTP